jgi:hypothetical protein
MNRKMTRAEIFMLRKCTQTVFSREILTSYSRATLQKALTNNKEIS